MQTAHAHEEALLTQMKKAAAEAHEREEELQHKEHKAVAESKKKGEELAEKEVEVQRGLHTIKDMEEAARELRMKLGETEFALTKLKQASRGREAREGVRWRWWRRGPRHGSPRRGKQPTRTLRRQRPPPDQCPPRACNRTELSTRRVAVCVLRRRVGWTRRCASRTRASPSSTRASPT